MNELAELEDRVISCDDLKEVCALTVELTRLRQNECKHLCIDEFAPKVFYGSLKKLAMVKRNDLFKEDPCEGPPS